MACEIGESHCCLSTPHRRTMRCSIDTAHSNNTNPGDSISRPLSLSLYSQVKHKRFGVRGDKHQQHRITNMLPLSQLQSQEIDDHGLLVVAGDACYPCAAHNATKVDTCPTHPISHSNTFADAQCHKLQSMLSASAIDAR
jgi:hypothetical protein